MPPWQPEPQDDTGPLRLGEVFAEKYEIRARLGHGGFGSVYLANHTVIGWECALKVLYKDSGLTRDLLERGKKEARILIDVLNHPHIVDVKDAGIDPRGMFYMVMEYLRGRTLRDVLREYRRLSVLETLAYFAQVAAAVHVAHEAGIVHRDLKPENLFVIPGNAPKVLDFGIAKLLDPSDWKTLPNVVMGTVKYLTPEQLMDRSVSAKSDIYTLGEVMFECLAGEHWCWIVRPELTNPGEMPGIKMLDHPPRLDELGLGIPPYVADLVQRAMLRRPEQRFATALEFADEMLARIDEYLEEMRQEGRVPRHRELWHVPPVDTAATSPQGTLFPEGSSSSEGNGAADAGDRTVEDHKPSFAASGDATRPAVPSSLRPTLPGVAGAAVGQTLEPTVTVAPAAPPPRPEPAPTLRQREPRVSGRRGLAVRMRTPASAVRRWGTRLWAIPRRALAWAAQLPWSRSLVLSATAFGLAVGFLLIVFVLEPEPRRSSDGPAVVEVVSQRAIEESEPAPTTIPPVSVAVPPAPSMQGAVEASEVSAEPAKPIQEPEPDEVTTTEPAAEKRPSPARKTTAASPGPSPGSSPKKANQRWFTGSEKSKPEQGQREKAKTEDRLDREIPWLRRK